ncbi:MAG: DNA adenine methylase [Planctomycetota bacterium]
MTSLEAKTAIRERFGRDFQTLWYMGVKTRLVPGFIDGAVRDLLAPGGTLLDLCTGTATVARAFASRYRVLANDALRFSATLARAHLEGGAGWPAALDALDPELELDAMFQQNFAALAALEPAALAKESALLARICPGNRALAEDPTALAEYREFVAATPPPELNRSAATASPTFEPFASSITDLLATRRSSPATRPCALFTLYFQNVYFGVRQSMVIDSLRAAIDALPMDISYRAERQALYLGALLQACSTSTSGTSHFAQPRGIEKDSELIRVANRRAIDLELEFASALDAIRGEWAHAPRDPRNRVFALPADELLASDGPLAREEVGLVYLDPPYTSDNYSRFYHVLETLVSYDYPEIERRGAALTRARYPRVAARHQSEFCQPANVEAAFRKTAQQCRQLGARLLVSYSLQSGLLLKRWRKAGDADPRRRFHQLFRDYYESVEIREMSLMHSGQGDSNLNVQELLVLCEEAH